MTTTSTAPSFPRSDPSEPAFWNHRFDAAFTPWDQGGIPDCLDQYVIAQGLANTENNMPKPRILIPGCGAAYELKLFASLGCRVRAIDFSPAAVSQARSLLGENTALAHMVQEADFFVDRPDAVSDGLDEKNGFDIVYERAFLCALPRRLWPNWSKRIAEIISSGGHLAGFFFHDDAEKGPPFGLKPGELETMLEPNFVRSELKQPNDSILIFANKETWQVWVRR